jgi:predicted nuclease of predicted toxin-antitoxin system
MENVGVKLLLDEHLSRKLVPQLEGIFPGTTHVLSVNLQTKSDDELWEFAKVNGFTVVTKDEDFQVLSFARGHPPKVIWLRSGNGPTREILAVLLRYRAVIEQFAESEDRSLLVLP